MAIQWHNPNEVWARMEQKLVDLERLEIDLFVDGDNDLAAFNRIQGRLQMMREIRDIYDSVQQDIAAEAAQHRKNTDAGLDPSA